MASASVSVNQDTSEMQTTTVGRAILLNVWNVQATIQLVWNAMKVVIFITPNALRAVHLKGSLLMIKVTASDAIKRAALV